MKPILSPTSQSNYIKEVLEEIGQRNNTVQVKHRAFFSTK
jgi:hypothetical protein